MITTLQILTPIIALSFLVAFVLMLHDERAGDQMFKSLGMKMWIGHITFYWCALTVSLFIFGYIWQPKWVNIWAAIIALQAAFSIIGAVFARRRWLD